MSTKRKASEVSDDDLSDTDNGFAVLDDEEEEEIQIPKKVQPKAATSATPATAADVAQKGKGKAVTVTPTLPPKEPENELLFSFKFEDIDFLCNLVATISALIKEGNWYVSESRGVYMDCMEVSRVGLVRFNLDPPFDPTFVCKGNHTLGINFTSFMCILKYYRKGCHTLTFRMYSKTPDWLNLIFSKDDQQTEIDLRMMDIDGETVEAPPFDRIATVCMTSSRLSGVIHEMCSAKYEIISIKISPGKMAITGSNNENTSIGDATTNILDCPPIEGKPTDSFCEIATTRTMTFQLSALYVSKMVPKTPMSQFALIIFNPECPCEFLYIKNPHCKVSFLLAPKMDAT
jgi:proliferating cell nuclear antigen PCNA